MNRESLENEARFLERVAQYRQEYRSSRSAAVNEERERRHASDEVYFAGCWVPQSKAGRLVHIFQRKELFTFIEIIVLLAVLLVIAQGLCSLFTFLLLP
jgi:hypothetical protein